MLSVVDFCFLDRFFHRPARNRNIHRRGWLWGLCCVAPGEPDTLPFLFYPRMVVGIRSGFSFSVLQEIFPRFSCRQAFGVEVVRTVDLFRVFPATFCSPPARRVLPLFPSSPPIFPGRPFPFRQSRFWVHPHLVSCAPFHNPPF